MRGQKNRRWVLRSRPTGMVGREHFEWREEPIPSIGDGEFLVRNLWLSCDPAQRAWMQVDTYIPIHPLGEVMLAGSAGEIVESNHPDWAPGDLVAGTFGWQDYAVSDGGGVFPATKIPAGVDCPTALSLLGVTGLTAHIGLLHIGQPTPGETVVVSGAAGSVGSLVVQIAKLKQCRVVGIAGGAKKCAWLTDELGLDGAIDYASEDVVARLGELCPDGVDLFFDNVGGQILDAVLDHIAIDGRVVLCGAISGYNDFERRPGIRNHYRLIIRRATMRGFLVFDHMDRVPEAIGDLVEWAATRRIENRVDVVEGLENTLDAFNRLFTGENLGKQLVKIVDTGASEARPGGAVAPT
jgi:NADPH-dependent curcumin reductase